MYMKEDDLPSAVAINYHVYAMAGVQTRQIKSNGYSRKQSLPYPIEPGEKKDVLFHMLRKIASALARLPNVTSQVEQ